MDLERAQRVYNDFRARVLSSLKHGGTNPLVQVEAWERARATVAENSMTVCVYGVQSVHSRLVNQLPSDYIIDGWKASIPPTNMSINGNGALQMAPMQTLTVALRWRFNYFEYAVKSAVHSLQGLVVGLLWLVALTVFVMLAWWVLHMLAARALPSWFGSAADVPGPWTRARTAFGALSWRMPFAAATPPSDTARADHPKTQQQPARGAATAAPIRHARAPQSSSPPLERTNKHGAAVGQESPPIGVMQPLDDGADDGDDRRQRHGRAHHSET
jgi:hypothetical protein